MSTAQLVRRGRPSPRGVWHYFPDATMSAPRSLCNKSLSQPGSKPLPLRALMAAPARLREGDCKECQRAAKQLVKNGGAV